MSALLRALRSAPLFVQVLALMLAALVGAQLLTAAIIVFLPPPSPELYRLSDVAAALKTGGGAERLHRTVVDAPPQGAAPGPDMRRGPVINPAASRALARLLGVAPGEVRVVDQRPRPMFDPMIRFGAGGPRTMPPRGPRAAGDPAGLPPSPPGLPRDPPGFAFGGGISAEAILFGSFKAAMRGPDGAWVQVQPRQSAAATLWRQRVAIWLIACTALFAPLAFLFARLLTAPIAAFARAAERLGRNPRAPELALDGPVEVRMAVSAFNQMQERLARYVDDRTAMVGAIAHDLRTPLTRMRFLLARPDDARDKMEREIDEMDAMISAAIAFVRDASTVGVHVRLDLGALVESLAADLAEAGAPIVCEACPRLLVRGDPLALRRLFGNLLTNAVKFAQGAEVSARLDGPEVVVTVADRGPGIDEADLEQAFEPFFRGETSRSRETGGIGLGLAVVRSVARAHGGDAVLSNRPGGGLCCTVRIPADKASD